jgi:Helix-turn-helix domain
MKPRRGTYTIEEAGLKLGVGRNQAYDTAKRGEILTIKIGRRKLVPGELLDRLVAGQTLFNKPSFRAIPSPREIGKPPLAPNEPALPHGDRNARQLLQRLMVAAIEEAEGDEETALGLFVDQLFLQQDCAALIWSLLSRGREDALHRLFDKASAVPPPHRSRSRSSSRGI